MQVWKQLWKVHEAYLLNERTGKTHVMQMNTQELANPLLIYLLEPFFMNYRAELRILWLLRMIHKNGIHLYYFDWAAWFKLIVCKISQQ